ncbi:b0dd9802-009d-4c6c-a18f-d0a4bb4da8d4 [Sclerotinia trifoliorum]|uniref:B0dd9802-009d-4c6c-a18f-d0a4bb4da8d4 n=1 Tax=Sclerotinia trifoliorum TaxID=28548 RepID=A0A8H2W3F4_9HELO|nr:b0dd9802-009d-4c6c-a18f-d0a4bb4da8d4 [Sclerotinia trifoliorum]
MSNSMLTFDEASCYSQSSADFVIFTVFIFFNMEGLSSASAAFAVISLAVQLAESVKKLVEFWQAIEDAPGDVSELFSDLELLSAFLVNNQKKFARHSPYDLIAQRIFSKCQKRIEKLHEKLHPTMVAFTSSSSRKRKWAALKVTLKNEEIKKMRTSVGESLVAVQMIQQDAISDMAEMALRHQEETSKGISAIQEIVVQYSQNLNPMHGSKSLSSTYASSMLLEEKKTTELSLLDLHRDKESHGYSQPTSTTIDARNAMIFQNSSPAILDEVGSSVNDIKKQIIGHTSSKTRLWETDGQTPIFSFRVSSASTKTTSANELSSHETIETRIGIVFYPAKWLYRLGVTMGIRMSATVDNGWMFTFSSFGAVPEDALIFDLCRQGNVAGVKILLGRGDASLECENPQGKTPLWTAVNYGQVDVARFLIAAGAKNTANKINLWQNPVVLDARRKIAIIETLEFYSKYKGNSIYGTIGRLSIFYTPSKRLDMTQEEISDNMLCVFKALTPSLRTGNAAAIRYLHEMLSSGHCGSLIHWLISRLEGNLDVHEDSVTSYSLLHCLIGARFLHRDLLSVRMIMEKTTDLHSCHGYGAWGQYQPQTPTVLAMYDQDLFIPWRQLLLESKQDMDTFIEREVDAKQLTSMGWTKATLKALFRHQFNTPSYEGRRPFHGFPVCDRCNHVNISISMLRLKIDLEFRRQLREIRTGRSQIPLFSHTTDVRSGSSLSLSVDENGHPISNSSQKTWPPLPYRFVCSDSCRDGISVHDVFENNLEDLPVFPPYISKEEQERLEQLRLAEEEAKCPTYKMPGAF